MSIWVLITQLPSEGIHHQEKWTVLSDFSGTLLKKSVETAHPGKIPPAEISNQLGVGNFQINHIHCPHCLNYKYSSNIQI